MSKTQRQQVLERFFRGLPVKEAEMPLLVVAEKSDVANATPGDPANCAMSQACKRLYNSTAVVFFRSIAYVDLPDENGERAVHRFVLNGVTRENIIEFDRTGEFPAGGFRLTPPNNASTLDARRQYDKAHGENRRRAARKRRQHQREAIIQGEAVDSGKQHAINHLEGVRSGSGMVHFSQNSGSQRA